MAIQIRRGTEAQWNNGKSNIKAGEPAITTDTGRLFVGTGTGTYKEFLSTTSTMPSANLLGWQGKTLTQNGSDTFTLVSSYTYLAVVTRLNYASDSYTGVYIIRPYHNSSGTGATSIATIKASSSTTLSATDVTLTVSTTTSNTSIVLFPIRSVVL